MPGGCQGVKLAAAGGPVPPHEEHLQILSHLCLNLSFPCNHVLQMWTVSSAGCGGGGGNTCVPCWSAKEMLKQRLMRADHQTPSAAQECTANHKHLQD